MMGYGILLLLVEDVLRLGLESTCNEDVPIDATQPLDFLRLEDATNSHVLVCIPTDGD